MTAEPRSPARPRALVTGAAGGIGRAVAVALAAAGCEVTVVDRAFATDPDPAGDFERRVCDLSDERQRRQLVESVPAIDVLVNNAAIYPRTPIADLPSTELRAVLEVNLVAAVDLMTRYAPPMGERGWGRIINITSITALGGFAAMGAYAASKAGLLAASMVASTEFGPAGVTVNCVAPGAIPTAAEPAGTSDDAVIARQSVPFRGTPADIAHAVAFLATDAARFISAQTVPVDGGWRIS